MKNLSSTFYKVARIVAIVLLIVSIILGLASIIGGAITLFNAQSDSDIVLGAISFYGGFFCFISCIVSEILVIVFAKKGVQALDAQDCPSSQIAPIVIGALSSNGFLTVAAILGLIHLKRQQNEAKAAPAEETVEVAVEEVE